MERPLGLAARRPRSSIQQCRQAEGRWQTSLRGEMEMHTKRNADSYFPHSELIFVYLSRFIFYLKREKGFHSWLRNILINLKEQHFDFVPCQVQDEIHWEIKSSLLFCFTFYFLNWQGSYTHYCRLLPQINPVKLKPPSLSFSRHISA